MIQPVVSQAWHGDIHFLRCSGDLRHTLAPSVQGYVDQLLASTPPQGFVIDLTQAQGIDSTCLGLLGHIANQMQAINGSRVCLVVKPSDILTTLLQMGFDEVFDIVDQYGQTPADIIPVPLQDNPERQQLLATMLQSHRILMDMNEGNRAVFADLVNLLEQESRQHDPEPEP